MPLPTPVYRPGTKATLFGEMPVSSPLISTQLLRLCLYLLKQTSEPTSGLWIQRVDCSTTANTSV